MKKITKVLYLYPIFDCIGLRTVVHNSANKKGKIEDKTLRVQVTVALDALEDENESPLVNNNPIRQV
jgi:hypothetical protein